MNLTAAAGAAVATAIKNIAAKRPNVDVVICPTFVSMTAIRDALQGSAVSLGAQNVFWKESGAYTGEVAPSMLLEAGCKFCIVGHSERRGRFGTKESHAEYFADTNETVALKTAALIFSSLKPILCVGETISERESGKTEAVIVEQLSAAFARIAPEEFSEVTIAYEPVWAIGTGEVCDAQEANRVCEFIRSQIAATAGGECAAEARILYGGSVKPENSREILACADVDGALVGGASLDADAFGRIILSA
jgi:triosephosphate isomerase